MREEKREEFVTSLYSYISSLDEEGEERGEEEVDAVLSDSDYGEDIWKTLSVFQPFGQENGELRFYVPRATVREAYHVGNSERYMRLSVECGGYIWPAVWWNASGEAGIHPGSTVALIFSPEINWWKGVGKEQFNISAIEVIK